ncbi:DUF4168 domain-containing protein [Spirochaeta africana]
MDQPGMDQPGMDQPGMDQPGMDQPGMDQPGMEQPGMEQPGDRFTEADIESFAAALDRIEEIQAGIQEEANAIIAESGIEPEVFQQTAPAAQPGQVTAPDNLSPEDQEQFYATYEELMEVEMAAQDDMIEIVQNEGLDVATFNDMVVVAQQDPQLWEEIQQYR